MNGTNGTLDTPSAASDRTGRRRRWEMTNDNVRYFLPNSESSDEQPELGQEMPTEGEALVQAFKSGQIFYTLVAWRAIPDISGNEPRIVKQALSRT